MIGAFAFFSTEKASTAFDVLVTLKAEEKWQLLV
jgi:hypothetical protein